MSFRSQRKLSTHEWHAHNSLRNVKRRGTTEAPNQESNSRVWSVEAVILLREFDQKFKNTKYLNVEIKRYLTSKTVAQIKNKRKGLKNEHVLVIAEKKP